jgi:hypothetical protein
MPIALLLKNMAGILKTAGSALAPWTQIVPLESTIVARARSAFLVHWFGPRIPVDGLSLKGIIVNIDALGEQRQLAERSLPKTSTGPNLFEPVMGFAGLVAGLARSPIGSIVGVITMLSVMDASVKTVLVAIGWIVAAFSLVFGMIVAPVGTTLLVTGAIAGGVAALALFAGLSDRNDIRIVFNLFGALARFMNAGEILLRQLLGGTAQARNPLLKRMMEMTTPIASLMAQLLGAVAALVRRVGPVLPSVASMLIALKGLIDTTFAALDEIAKGLLARIDEARNGPLSLAAVVNRLVRVATQQVEIIHRAFKGQLAIINGTLKLIRTKIESAFSTFLDEVLDFLLLIWKAHPVIQAIDAFRSQIDIITQAFKAAPTPAPTGKAGFFDPLIATLPKLPPMPDFPPLPDKPDAERLKVALGGDDIPPLNFDEIEKAATSLGKTREPIVLSEEARRAIEKTMRRPSVFEPERKVLAAELGSTPAAALEANAKQLEKLREVFAVVVGRILPPEMRAVYAPMLAETFHSIDQKLYGIEGPMNQPPVLDLPTSEDLRPMVRLLRFRMPGHDPSEVRAFQDKLLDRLRTQKYRAPTAAMPVGAP